MKLAVKIPLIILMICLAPSLLMGVMVYNNAMERLQEDFIEHLDLAGRQAEADLRGIDAHLLLTHEQLCSRPLVTEFLKQAPTDFDADALRAEFISGQTGSVSEDYRRWNDRLESILLSYMDELTLYDIFLISPEGDVLFTQVKEDDFATNLRLGEFAASGLGAAYRDALLQPGKAVYSSFERYAPSGQTSSGFMARTVSENGRILGVLAFQLSADPLRAMLSSRQLLGEEHVLELFEPGRAGSLAHLAGSGTVLAPAGLGAISQIAKKGGFDSAPAPVTETALDVAGEARLLSVSELEFMGRPWLLLSHMPRQVLEQSASALRDEGVLVALVVLLFSCFVGLFFSRRVLGPVEAIGEQLVRFGLERRIIDSGMERRTDEVGVISRKIGDMQASILDYVAEVEATRNRIDDLNLEMKAMLDGAPDAQFIVDQEGLITQVNRQVVALTCYSEAELVGAHIGMLMPQEVAVRHRSLIDTYFSNPSLLNLDTRRDKNFMLVNRDRHEIPVDIALSPIESESGVMVMAAVRDARARLAYQQQIIDEQEQFQRILETMTIPMMVVRNVSVDAGTDPRFSVLFHNAAALTLSAKQQSLIGEVNPLGINAADLKAVYLDFGLEQGISNRLVRTQDAEGQYHSCLMNVDKLNYRGEKAFLVWLFDITERMEQEKQLLQANRLLELTNEVIGISNRNEQFEQGVSAALEVICETMHWPGGRVLAGSDEVPGSAQSVIAEFYDETEVGAQLARIMKSDILRYAQSTERCLVTLFAEWARLDAGDHSQSDLSRRLLDAGMNTVISLPISNGMHCHAVIELYARIDEASIPLVIRSLTQSASELEKLKERIMFLEDLTRAKIEAEAAARVKSSFLANMSHEIRTPMNAIIGMSHLAWDKELEPRQKDRLLLIKKSAESLLGIINDVLDFSKIEAGKLEVEETDFDLGDVTDYVLNLIRHRAQEKSLKLQYVEADDVPHKLRGDPLRLGQILTNLLTNAVKFTDVGEVCLKVFRQAAEGDGCRLRFEVHDTGIGIDSSEQKKLFRSFSQVDASTTRKFGGSGLGLAISSQLAHLMGGTVDVQSEPGKGSVFSLEVLLRRSEQASDEGETVPVCFSSMNAVVYHTSSSGGEVIVAYLRRFGITTTLIKLVGRKPDLPEIGHAHDMILIDDSLSAAARDALCRQIHEPGRPESLVILLGSCEESDLPEGAVCIDKPVTPSRLLDALMNAFGQSWPDTAPRALAQDGGRQSLAGLHLLLVEDNEINQEVALELLADVGITADVAGNGREALDILQAGARYDGVLMDCQMPVMDGYEAARLIRAEPALQRLPILAMTANAMAGDVERSLSAGMDDHIAKPIDVNDFYLKIGEWFGQNDSQQDSTGDIGEPAGTVDAIVEKVPMIPGVDTAAGLVRVAGNSKLYLKMLRKFIDQQEDFGQRFLMAWRSRDGETATREAHTLKSLAGSLGIDEVYTLAAELEAASRDQKETDVESSLVQLESLLSGTLVAIRRSLDVQTIPSLAAVSERLDDAELASQLLALREMIASFDTAATERLSEILGQVDAAQAARLHPLTEALDTFDFEEALRAIELLSR